MNNRKKSELHFDSVLKPDEFRKPGFSVRIKFFSLPLPEVQKISFHVNF